MQTQEFNVISEGEFRFDKLLEHINRHQLSGIVTIGEDATRIISRVEYDNQTDRCVGFVLPIDENSLPIINSFVATSYEQIEHMFSNYSIAKYAYAYMVKPLDSQSPSFCLGCLGTDNKFIAETVIMRWNYIVSECKKRNIHVISFGGDGDSRLMRAMQISTGLFFQSSVLANTVCASSLKSPRIPESWHSWFLIKHPSAITYVQDTIHIAVKLKTRLLRHSLVLPIGNYIVAVQHLQLLYANFQKEQHGLRQRDLDSKDKQNFDAVINIIRASPYLDKIPDALGTKLYIEVIQNIIDSYLDKTLDPLQRIEKIWYSLFFLRYWRSWISVHPAYSLQANFITANTYKCVELNAHALIIALIISRDNFEGRCCFMPWLFGSQSCEEAFRSVRSMSGIFSTVINFGMLGLLRRLHRLNLLSRLEAESKETGIIYPDQARQINKMAIKKLE